MSDGALPNLPVPTVPVAYAPWFVLAQSRLWYETCVCGCVITRVSAGTNPASRDVRGASFWLICAMVPVPAMAPVPHAPTSTWTLANTPLIREWSERRNIGTCRSCCTQQFEPKLRRLAVFACVALALAPPTLLIVTTISALPTDGRT